jgi:CRISPR-associated protein Cas1
MKKLLNTLYVTTPDAYLSLDGENVVVQNDAGIIGRVPLHNLEGIFAFGYVGASPALMGKCADYNKALVFLKPNGQFLAKVTGKSYGNILLRRQQYRLCDQEVCSCEVAKNIVAAKIMSSASVINRMIRDHEMRIDAEAFRQTDQYLKEASKKAFHCQNQDQLRGIEGESAQIYFSKFDDMILRQKEDFYFRRRNRRPPLDNVNALLSFGYSLMTSLCVSALESVGLDPYCGVFHTDRPGRCSLALDLMEEFRAPFVDRFVLTLINKGMVCNGDFIRKESGGIMLTDEGRKIFLSAWQQKKQETLQHPYLKEKVEWGLMPYVQAMLLARYIRGDLDTYPAFVWK